MKRTITFDAPEFFEKLKKNIDELQLELKRGNFEDAKSCREEIAGALGEIDEFFEYIEDTEENYR